MSSGCIIIHRQRFGIKIDFTKYLKEKSILRLVKESQLGKQVSGDISVRTGISENHVCCNRPKSRAPLEVGGIFVV